MMFLLFPILQNQLCINHSAVILQQNMDGNLPKYFKYIEFAGTYKMFTKP